jgi:hypothetical protein
VPLNGLHGVLERAELNVGVHGLASHALHDNVHRLVRVVEDT